MELHVYRMNWIVLDWTVLVFLRGMTKRMKGKERKGKDLNVGDDYVLIPNSAKKKLK